MKPQSTIRSAIKWIGAVITALLAIIWIGSAWCTCGFSQPGGPGVGVAFGQFRIRSDDSRSPSQFAHGWHFYYVPGGGFEWWFRGMPYDSTAGYGYLLVPLWFPLLLVGVPTMLIWRSDRRGRRAERGKVCPKCGYDRTGLPPERVCPECGMPVSVKTA